MKKIIYVAGSEGTGTRFISSLIGRINDVDAHNAEKHEQDFDRVWDLLQRDDIDMAVAQFKQITNEDMHVLMRRSYPHGASPVWYNIANLNRLAERVDRNLVVVVPTRDIGVLRLSLCRVDPDKNIRIASERIKKAYDTIFTYIEHENIEHIIFSYESLMLLGHTYFAHEMRRIGLNPDIDPTQVRLRDGNRKYLKDESLPVDELFDRVTVQPQRELEYA